MRILEKWLLKPFAQRIMYLMLLLLCLYIFSNNGVLQRAATFSSTDAPSLAVALGLVAALGAQLVWNKRWLWMLLCIFMVCFTLWLATLSLSQIIASAGPPAKAVVWAVGVIGFMIVLGLFLAFLNWLVLHMKPKK